MVVTFLKYFSQTTRKPDWLGRFHQNTNMNKREPANACIPVWSPDLSVGNAKLDEQHITLLELGRHLIAEFEAGPTASEDLAALLQDILTLANRHDAAEEELLAANDCPTLAEHRAEHRSKQARLEELMQQAVDGSLNRALATQLIIDWMSHHLSESDWPVRDYLKQKAERAA